MGLPVAVAVVAQTEPVAVLVRAAESAEKAALPVEVPLVPAEEAASAVAAPVKAVLVARVGVPASAVLHQSPYRHQTGVY